MTCTRCAGLMVWFYGPVDEWHVGTLLGWRKCVNCGDRMDVTMFKHRHPEQVRRVVQVFAPEGYVRWGPHERKAPLSAVRWA